MAEHDAALNRLRAGVSIPTDKGRRVKTAPAKIHTIREAANPWYEVTLIEGRQNQIKLMFRHIFSRASTSN